MIKNSVAIQGIRGSFHDIAAKKLLTNELVITECLSFDEVVSNVVASKVSSGIIAIENSIAGSILPNYALIDQFELQVVAECYIDVQHNLMALPGEELDTIREVHSHPMALLQCKVFFQNHPKIKLVEAKDTADVAKRIRENSLKGVAAIASEQAASIFELQILSKSIQTIKHNETRFVVIKNKDNNKKDGLSNKASLKFELDHKRGSLATILNVLSDCNLNLTKIQSLPKIQTPWKYAFFIDVTFEAYADFEKAKKVMGIMTENFKVLGEYKNAKL